MTTRKRLEIPTAGYTGGSRAWAPGSLTPTRADQGQVDRAWAANQAAMAARAPDGAARGAVRAAFGPGRDLSGSG
jgi:hypothetical protein